MQQAKEHKHCPGRPSGFCFLSGLTHQDSSLGSLLPSCPDYLQVFKYDKMAPAFPPSQILLLLLTKNSSHLLPPAFSTVVHTSPPSGHAPCLPACPDLSWVLFPHMLPEPSVHRWRIDHHPNSSQVTTRSLSVSPGLAQGRTHHRTSIHVY